MAKLARQTSEDDTKRKDLIKGHEDLEGEDPSRAGECKRMVAGRDDGFGHTESVRFARKPPESSMVSGDKGERAADADQQMAVGRISSGLASSSKSAAAVGAGAGFTSKAQRFDMDNHLPAHHRHASSQPQPLPTTTTTTTTATTTTTIVGGSAGGGGGGGKKRPNLGGYSSTMISSASAGSGQPTSQRAYLASDNERHKRKLAKARERRATLILGLIMAAFICSWLPFFTFYVLRAICSSCKENVSPRFEAFIFWMGYCNSAINPIIYTIFNRDFRKAFRKILFKCL